MKKLVTIVFLFLFSGLQAEVITYNDSWGATGFNLESQKLQGVEVIFSLSHIYLENQMINGENLQTLHIPGIFLPNDAGAPDLPGTGRYLAVPQGAEVSFELISYRSERLTNINLAPAPRLPLETEDGPLEYEYNSQIYSNDAFYPQNPVKLSDITQIRGVDVVLLGITPFQYNPVSRELLIYRDLQVRVNFSGGNNHFGEDRLRSRWWDPLLRDIVLNQESLQPVEYRITSELMTQDFEYLIIIPDNPDYNRWADSIRVFRTMQGIRTGIVTLTEVGGNNTSLIESYINNAYTNWNIPPSAILFMADYGTGSATGNGIVSPIYDSYCISDHIYADVNGNHMADIVVARMTAQNAQQLEIMVRKFIDYETQPPTNPDYYNHPVTAMGWQTERWFQICSESINGFWEYVLGKQPVRENAIYSGTPTGSWSSNSNTGIVVDYFGPNGLGYIPATPNHLTDWGGNASRLNNDINTGAFMVQHRDHGAVSGWGEPYYRISSLSGLNNNDLTFVFSINCLTGQFDAAGECFAEAFHRYPKRALGIIAATESSYSFVNDTYVWGLYDNMWPEFMPAYGTTPMSRGILPAFGNVAGKYFLQQSSWPYNPGSKEVTYYLFHHHGDAFTTVYSEMPQNLTVSHTMVLYGGQTSFIVTADEDALVALTVNGEIIGVAPGTGTPVSITIPPQMPGNTMKVTVTKQNYYRYSQEVPIVAATGPYLYCLNTVTQDSTTNDNGIPESGETIELKLVLTNLGVEAASNITAILSCSDSLLTIMNGGISAITDVDTTDTLVCGSFLIEISETTPHLHNCMLDLQLEADSAGIPSGFMWQQVVPVTIREGAKIAISDNIISFPATFLNFTAGAPFTLSNLGPDTLFVRDIFPSKPQFTVSESSFSVDPGAQQEIQVFFTPDDTLHYDGTITILSTDPVNFEISFNSNGKGIFSPDIYSAMDTVKHIMPGTDST
ncbi:MAG: hypothetical protein EH225_02575, partial [Calditrichaeota bacterium]